MKVNSADNFDEWLAQLVRTSVPFEVQRKIVNCEKLSAAEFKQFSSTVILAVQARQFGNQTTIKDKLDTLIRDSRRNGDMIRETLWHASGKLPQYKPTDGRSIGVVKQGMVQMAVERILSGKGPSPRAILNAILEQYSEIPGGYDSLTPFLRQVERVMKKTEHNMKDMF